MVPLWISGFVSGPKEIWSLDVIPVGRKAGCVWGWPCAIADKSGLCGH